ncbi:hypothetical protein Hamer_G014024, partial [Homarus americanus]
FRLERKPGPIQDEGDVGGSSGGGVGVWGMVHDGDEGRGGGPA